jgi:hypothetical protein
MGKFNIKNLASKIAFREGGKHSATIGDIREILRIIADLSIEEGKEWLDILYDYAADRANRHRNKRAKK